MYKHIKQDIEILQIMVRNKKPNDGRWIRNHHRRQRWGRCKNNKQKQTTTTSLENELKTQSTTQQRTTILARMLVLCLHESNIHLPQWKDGVYSVLRKVSPDGVPPFSVCLVWFQWMESLYETKAIAVIVVSSLIFKNFSFSFLLSC